MSLIIAPTFSRASIYIGAPHESEDDQCDDCFDEGLSLLAKPVNMGMGKDKNNSYFPSDTIPGTGMLGKPGTNSATLKTGKKNTPTSQLNDLILKAIDKTPKYLLNNEEKNAFKSYLDTLGANKYNTDGVGGENTGIKSYFEKLWGASRTKSASSTSSVPIDESKVAKASELEQCFRDTALNFYRDVAIRLRSIKKVRHRGSADDPQFQCDDEEKNKAKLPKVAVDYGCEGERSGLLSRVGDENSSNLEPGWLWKLALKHSKGDANAAMHLIGMCGHDDTAQSQFSYQDDSEAAKIELSNQLNELNVRKVELEKQVKDAANNVATDPAIFMKISRRFSRIIEKIKDLEKKQSLSRTLFCPRGTSAFYAPGGLSEEADISSSLKDKISKIQNPTGKLKIPGKHYHVYGAAFMACNLITNGFDPQKAVTVQKQAARVYRGTRMCESSNRLMSQSDDFEKTVGREASRNRKSVENYILDSLKNIDPDDLRCKSDNQDDLKSCTLVRSLFGDSVRVMSIDPEAAKGKILSRLARIDAAKLYNSWYVGGGEILGKKIPCTDIRMGGPRNLMDANNSIVPFYGARPDGWSKERYAAATKQLATWDVDFEWTIAQHEAGAKFAAKNCKKATPGKNPFQNLCSSRTTSDPTMLDVHKGAR